MSSIHGHEVIHLIQQNHYADEASLLADIAAIFGENARFHTCSQADLTAQELVEFLKMRGKFVPDHAGTLTVDPAKICQHG